MTWTPSAQQLRRDAFRRRRTTRSAVIALVSTVVVATALIVGTTSSPGWPRVKETFFSWDKAKESFPAVLSGFWFNLEVFAISAVAMLAFGMLLAVLRTLQGPVFFPLRAFAVAYVDLFRGMPVIITIILIGLGLPGLRLQGVPTSALVLSTIALTLTYSAYVAEVFRAGIESVHPSQTAAARSLGLSSRQTLRFVVLPQAVRRVVPPLLNDIVSLTKDSSLVTVAGAAVDSIRAAQIETATSFNFTPYVVAAFLFLVLTIPLTRLTDYVAGRRRS